MTKTETRLLTREQLKRKASGQTKTAPYKRDQGIFLIGYIQCLRDTRKLFETGNEMARMFAEFCAHRQQAVVKQLRRL
jgi:hypothetical protein